MKKFYEKLLSSFKEAGEQLIKKVLRLYYVSVSNNCPFEIKLAIFSAISYFISLIDLIPDVTPIVGYTDDASVIGIVIAAVASYVDENIATKVEAKYNKLLDKCKIS